MTPQSTTPITPISYGTVPKTPKTYSILRICSRIVIKAAARMMDHTTHQLLDSVICLKHYESYLYRYVCLKAVSIVLVAVVKLYGTII